jgi:hypothetical protein
MSLPCRIARVDNLYNSPRRIPIRNIFDLSLENSVFSYYQVIGISGLHLLNNARNVGFTGSMSSD